MDRVNLKLNNDSFEEINHDLNIKITKSNYQYLVFKDDIEIAKFRMVTNDTLEGVLIYPKYQGKGYGRPVINEIFKFVLDEYKEVFFCVDKEYIYKMYMDFGCIKLNKCGG